MSVRLPFDEGSISFHFHKVSREEDSLRRDGDKPHRDKQGHPTLQALTAQKRSVIRIRNNDELHFVLVGLGVKNGMGRPSSLVL